MKKLIFSLFVLCLPMAMAAEDEVSNLQPEEANHKSQTSNLNSQIPRAVYLELLGGSSMAGVTYDARFNDHTHWGWRAGLAFAYSSSNNFINGSDDERYWAVPVGVNYLVGNRSNSLEIGLGASLGIVNQHTTEWSVYSEDITMDEYNRYAGDPSLMPANASAMGVYIDEAGNEQAYISYLNSRGRSENTFGYYFFGDIGYRHVSRHGFLFRCGLNPAFNFGGKHAISRAYGSNEFHKFALGLYLGFGWIF